MNTKETTQWCIFFGLYTILLNLPILNNNYLYWDDNREFFKNYNLLKPWDSWEDAKWIFGFYQDKFRPLSWLICKLTLELFGTETLGLRILSLGLHSANAALMFILLCRILEVNKSNQVLLKSGIICLLWVCNPLRVEPVAWASGLPYLIATFFVLSGSALIVYNKKGHLAWDISGYLLLVCASLSYPIAILAPLTGLIWMGIRGEGAISSQITSKRFKQNLLLTIISTIPSLWVAWATFQHRTNDYVGGLLSWDTIIKVSNRISYYVGGTLFPPTTITPAHYPSNDIWVLTNIIGLIAITMLIYAVVSNKHNRAKNIMMTMVATLMVIPVIGVTDAPRLAPDRYSYLISTLILMGITSTFLSLKSLNKPSILLSTIYLAILSVWYIKEERKWNGTETLFSHIKSQDDFNNNQAKKFVLIALETEMLLDLQDYHKAYSKSTEILDIGLKDGKILLSLLQQDLLEQAKWDAENGVEAAKEFLGEK
jgi:hypothetical protein